MEFVSWYGASRYITSRLDGLDPACLHIDFSAEMKFDKKYFVLWWPEGIEF